MILIKKVKIILILYPTHLSVSICGTTGALAVGADCLVSSVTFSPSDMSCKNNYRGDYAHIRLLKAMIHPSYLFLFKRIANFVRGLTRLSDRIS